LQACHLLYVQAVHFDLPDCIYRHLPDGSPLIQGEEDLWQPIPAGEEALVGQIADLIATRLQPESRLVIPLSIGNHIDHRLVRAAGLRISPTVYFYADFPYSSRPEADLNRYLDPKWRRKEFSVSNAALSVWRAAIACYASQITSLWSDLKEMEVSLVEYYSRGGGKALWKKTE
jgi:LmbE family N-acetylglucosaminyl deacetylase